MLADLRADLERYTGLVNEPMQARLWRSLLDTQGVWGIHLPVWSLGQRRGARPLRKPAKAAYLVGFKLVEIATGVSLPAHAHIGAGFYIGHLGNIIIHPDTVMGERAASRRASPSASLAANGRRAAARQRRLHRRGRQDPRQNKIATADRRANAVVIADVPAGATAVGVPARIIQRKQAGAQSQLIGQFEKLATKREVAVVGPTKQAHTPVVPAQGAVPVQPVKVEPGLATGVSGGDVLPFEKNKVSSVGPCSDEPEKSRRPEPLPANDSAIVQWARLPVTVSMPLPACTLEALTASAALCWLLSDT